MDTIAKIDALTELIKERFDETDRRFEQIDRRFEQIDRRFEQIDQRFEHLEGDLVDVKEDISVLKADVASINITIENEISPNIKAVAEGHLDLSRNLHEAMKPNNLVEMLSVKVNMLETRIRELERRIS